MNAPPSPHTPENWDSASPGYARLVAPSLMEAFAEELVERLDPDPTNEALEIGAGSGALTETLARRVDSLLATDFAPRMIEVLSQRLRTAGVLNVRCEVMDGQDLALEDSTFDRAACSFALMLFPDRARGFSELCRVLRPGGRALVTGWTGPDRFESFGLFLAGLNRAFPDMPPPPRPPAVFSLADPLGFKAEMEAGGFQDVEVDFVSRDLELPDFDSVWALITAGAPPVQVLLDSVGPTGTERLRDALAGVTHERFGSGPIRLTNTATVAVGTA